LTRFRRARESLGHKMYSSRHQTGRGADVHFHLLPGVDDGPDDMAETLELARAATAEGTGTIVATPHVRSDFLTDVTDLPERVRELQAVLDAERIALTVRCGGELGHDMVGRLRQDELETIAQGPPNARWLLVEAPFELIGEDFHTATDELRDRGFGVLVAHPERSADAALFGAAGLRRELAQGALAQVNALSLTGEHGEDAERAAFAMVRERLSTLVASDAHGPTRPPALDAARAALAAQGVNAAVSHRLIVAAPARLLVGGVPSGTPLAA
jgi:protein-tyrosine phosphatase